MPRRRRAARCACSCSAAARARASWPRSCRRRSSACAADLRARLSVVQQARAEDLDAVRATYAQARRRRRVSRRSSPICRRAWRRRISSSRAPAPRRWPSSRPSAGPAILVPLPHALDQDQFANAGVLAAAGGAIRIEQRDFTAERLAAEIARLGRRPGAPCAHGAGRQIGRHASMPPSGWPIWC